MSKHFSYYDQYKSEIFECPRCHWKGTFEEGVVRDSSELMDTRCPKCYPLNAPILAVVSYPTLQEMLDSGIPEDVAEAQRTLEKRKAFLAAALSSPEQLPDIPGDDKLELVWDIDSVEQGKQDTVIRYGDTVLFREPASWEAIDSRYEKICRILKQKYGGRLADVIPTPDSELWFYGDHLGGREMRDAIHNRVLTIRDLTTR